jgi:hypothetical protein
VNVARGMKTESSGCQPKGWPGRRTNLLVGSKKHGFPRVSGIPTLMRRLTRLTRLRVLRAGSRGLDGLRTRMVAESRILERKQNKSYSASVNYIALQVSAVFAAIVAFAHQVRSLA